MTEADAAIAFLETLERTARNASEGQQDFRFVVDVLDLVEAERNRIRVVLEPPWPDTLWHDYRIGLALVQRHILSVLDHYPEQPTEQVQAKVREVTGGLLALGNDIRAVARGQVH